MKHRIPAEPKPSDITALVDTREQLPLDLAPLQVNSTALASKNAESFPFLKNRKRSFCHARTQN
jgi:hypothetical protein